MKHKPYIFVHNFERLSKNLNPGIRDALKDSLLNLAMQMTYDEMAQVKKYYRDGSFI